jgi:S-formylglutathione hydrolase FrmB
MLKLSLAGVMTIALALGPVPGAAAAAWPECIERAQPIRLGLSQVSRAQRGRVVTLRLRSRALQGQTKVAVSLPRDYDRSGRTRYPVLYWMHGAGGSFQDWVERRDGLELMGDMPLIVVSPEGAATDASGTRRNGSYMDWFGLAPGDPGPAFAFESFHVRELIPFVDAHFPTRPTAAGRAVAGISMGGGGLRYAASFPGTFGYAGSLSGAVAHAPANQSCIRPDPARIPIVWRDNSAIDLARNLRGVRLFIRSGDGRPGPLDPVPPDADRLRTESVAYAGAQLLLDALRRERIGGVDAELYPGSHHEPYWRRELPELMAWLRARLRRPVGTRRSFDVENGRADFTAWGWRFQVRRRVRELVYLSVDGGAVSATGSGKLRVTTPPRYRARAVYLVRVGRRLRRIRADRTGRLKLALDLGASHTRQQTQFGPRATRGWRTVTARIKGRS